MTYWSPLSKFAINYLQESIKSNKTQIETCGVPLGDLLHLHVYDLREQKDQYQEDQEQGE